MTTYNTQQLQEIDGLHHIHPFTDHKALMEKGTRVITKADGVYLWDSDGNKILDGMAGLWCVNIGYGRQELVDAATNQMRELPYYNNFFQTTHPPAIELSKVLVDISPPQFNHVFFTNSGSEANDTMVRMVRHFWSLEGKPEKTVIISRENAYHGSTMGALTFMGIKDRRDPFGPLIPKVKFIKYNEEEDLNKMREEAKILKKPFRYNRMWREKNSKDAPQNIKPVIRIKSPIKGETIIEDIIQGTIKVSNQEIDDFIILRSDGTPTYMLSVVVDDYDMKVTHLIRGHDHLTNTFRQNVIYEAMQWNKPITAHIPLILGSDGSKMSKRHGAIDVEEYKIKGILPNALINYMLRLGWSHGDDEIISLENAIKWFSLEKIGKSPAKFDNEKLISVNSHYIKELNNDEIIKFLESYYISKYKIKIDEISIKRLNLGLDDIKSRSRDLNQLAEMSLFYCSKFPLSISKKAQKYIKKVDKTIFKDLLVVLGNTENDFKKQKIEEIMSKFLIEKGLKLSDIIQYIRAMITGLDVSPRIYDIMEILGFLEIKKRIENFIHG